MRGEPRRARGAVAPVLVWSVTRAVLLLYVFKVLTVPGGMDITSDVSVIYHGWFGRLSDGTFPSDDVTWQYPPGAALVILSPGLLTGVLPLGYASAFFVLACAADAMVLGLLLYAARRRGPRAPEAGLRGRAGVWAWVVGVPLLGPTAYARYDLMVTVPAVAALLAAARHPRAAGVLAGLGALVKVWPLLLLLGTPRGRATRAAWLSALLTVLLVTAGFAAAMPGALDFLSAQGGRGTEVESVGSLALHAARQFGWEGQVLLRYGSMEFVGPGVQAVSNIAVALTGAVFGWLLLWRLRARNWSPTTLADAALAAVLLFVVTSRVLSPQYLIWLLGLAAVCLTLRAGRQALPAWLVLVATGLTQLEFPVWFADVVTGEARGTMVLALRNLLLVTAAVLSCVRLWRSTVPGEPEGAADRDGGPQAVPAPRSTRSDPEPERDGVPGTRRPGGDRIPAPDATGP
ncbi:glycosyltransferase family 87 protein [Streptomyces sp. WMMB303]|uniref:glycosyltransferase family 87 protein n=1 Tax=Streptomyces sp. WMMB303 TaxID=3034154 RepID=UPI0023EC39AD|nr:glycosyltransferase family 87 protein [Streptomyces sp. WMMB303]MDF4250167.1 glycosyltransferase family 87 protein [Streptomyces sp. WMMB303]